MRLRIWRLIFALMIRAGSRFTTAFRALRHRNYQLWFFGQGISLVGTWMQSMAQQILVYRLTGSAISLGIVNLMTVIPLLPFSFWGGSLADRVSKRKILLITQSLMLCQAFILAALTWTGSFAHVYLMALILVKRRICPATIVCRRDGRRQG
jgi:MFS family permease